MHRPFRCHPNPSTLALLALFTGAAAQAQTPEGAYPYLGAGIGQARPRLDAARLGAAALSGSELTITSTSSDQRDTTYKLFGGLQFNRYLGVELSYFRLGQFSYRAITSPAGQLDGRLKVAGMNLDLVGSLPFSEDLSGLVRVGYQRARTSADWSGSGAVAGASRSARTNDSAPRYGVGLQYAVTQQFLMRLEAERSRFADAQGSTVRATAYTVSAIMPFGATPQPARRAAYVAPEPPRAEPALLPVAVVAVVAPPPLLPAPAPAPLRRVSFTAESLFGFDSAVLRPPGKAALDVFASELAGMRFDSIAVTGHADRLGSAAYNQALSFKRADAVKAYLVGSANVDTARISAQGHGESEPVTRPGDCKGAGSPRVIACLQPDRRVDIQVSGTR